MTPKEQYEARRQSVRDQRVAEETAYAARMRKEAAAEECVTVLMEGLRDFFNGQAKLVVEPLGGSVDNLGGRSVRFVRTP